MKNKLFTVCILGLLFLNSFAQTDYSTQYVKAVNYIAENNYHEAILLLESIADQGDYMLFYNLGYCHYMLGNDAETEICFKKSIELNDNFLQSHGYLGELYLITGQWDEAEKAFLRCIEIDRTNYMLYYYLGEINVRKKNMDKAINYYMEALKHNDRDFNTNYALARIYYEKEDYRNAERFFSLCHEIDGQQFAVVSYLILNKYRSGNLNNVEEFKQKLRAIKQNSDDAAMNEMSEFIIDIFAHKDFQIFVEESFDLSGDLYYHWCFIIYDREENFVKSVNLESSSSSRASGTPYVVGIDRYEDDRRIHTTTTKSFSEIPDYYVMKAIVIEEIETGLEVAATGSYPINN